MPWQEPTGPTGPTDDPELEKILRKYRDEGSTIQNLEVAANNLFENKDYLGALLCYQKIYDSEVSRSKEPTQKTKSILYQILDEMYGNELEDDLKKIEDYTGYISGMVTFENISEYLNEYLHKKEELDKLFEKYDVLSYSEQNPYHSYGKLITLADAMEHDSMKHFPKINPFYSNFMEVIAYSLFEQKQIGSADRYVKVAKKLDPWNRKAVNLEKKINAELEKARQAAIDYQNQKEDSLSGDELIKKAQFYWEKDLFDKSIECYSGAMEKGVTNSDDLVFLGKSYFENKLIEPAFDCMEAALKLNPAKVDILMDTGVMWFNLRTYGKAFSYFEKANKLQPNNQEILYYMTQAMFEIKNKKQLNQNP